MLLLCLYHTFPSYKEYFDMPMEYFYYPIILKIAFNLDIQEFSPYQFPFFLVK